MCGCILINGETTKSTWEENGVYGSNGEIILVKFIKCPSVFILHMQATPPVIAGHVLSERNVPLLFNGQLWSTRQ
jgi:hypothetical protein